ncbi:type III pantothenate kinase [Cellvibrio fibrivorans]|uniref:Type III pantothenate kinase n=1 Tax=Cellvibrio fibrivorans TaxID=126350 RepID=A0ABU1V456_9GAMM|nr:type III pantothenate kinase [Cellvibrio fibrivorans]MDR7092252.1 type III pantothenate kinase [Cellvibrio fibrivorans]
MILEIDMGNTRLKWRILDQRLVLVQGAIGIEAPLDLLLDEIEPYRTAINSVVVASVVGGLLEQKLADWSMEYLKLPLVFVRSDAACGAVRNGYREPQMLGVDRWLGIVAAYRLAASACIVVSCGTAITVDLVAQDGKHLGGFIAPGLNLMLDSLTSRTRQIKLNDMAPVLSLSPALATSDAVYSACAAMLTGLIDNGVKQLHMLDHNAGFQMIFTGGDAAKLLPFYPQARVVPDLVLDGLACVLDYPQGLE